MLWPTDVPEALNRPEDTYEQHLAIFVLLRWIILFSRYTTCKTSQRMWLVRHCWRLHKDISFSSSCCTSCKTHLMGCNRLVAERRLIFFPECMNSPWSLSHYSRYTLLPYTGTSNKLPQGEHKRVCGCFFLLCSCYSRMSPIDSCYSLLYVYTGSSSRGTCQQVALMGPRKLHKTQN